MNFIESRILNDLPNIRFGFSTKLSNKYPEPFHFNMSLSVGDDKSLVIKNRKLFAKSLQLELEEIAFQKQNHSDIIQYVESGGNYGESDALITDKKNVGLAISSADCSAIFIYDSNKSIIAGIHSGWRGTQKRIVTKTLMKMKERFSSDPKNLFAYIAPAISQKNYEVGKEVAEQFDKKYLQPSGDKYLLDVSGNNYDMLLDFGIPNDQIERSDLCSFENKALLHSYRREGQRSGRALGIIAMVNN
jgi:YfiH family protein